MIVQQYQLPCLSVSSYLIADESTGDAVIIDPQRDIGQYLADLDAKGLTLRNVLLTHFHADYVSGHLELQAATEAEICFGEAANAGFAVRHLADGDRIELGDVEIETWATPGHTPESISFLLYEHGGDDQPVAVFTGDALFVGDVGRPDLLGAIGFTAEALGSQLYDTVHRLMTLPGAVRVYPGHGAGSACGKRLGSEPFTTIAEQIDTNYALQPMTRDEFVALVTEGQPAAPPYFLHDAIMNRKPHAVFDADRTLPVLSMTLAAAAQHEDAVVVDTRSPSQFAAGHLVDALNVPLEGRFAERVGMVVPADRAIIVAGDAGSEDEAMTRLGRIGFDHVVGYIFGYTAELRRYPDRVVTAQRMSVGQLASLDDVVQLVDVRNPGETDDGMIPGATAIPLGSIMAEAGELDRRRPVVVYCASGVRSSVAASWLSANGFAVVSDVVGGYEAWTQTVQPA